MSTPRRRRPTGQPLVDEQLAVIVREVLGKAEGVALLGLVQEVATAAGVFRLDGLPIADWYHRQRALEFEHAMESIEDLDPALAAQLQAKLDELGHRPSPAPMINVVMGSRHQGEGVSGSGPRMHWENAAGLIVCGAVPRARGRARSVEKAAFVAGLDGSVPVCPRCVEIARE